MNSESQPGRRTRPFRRARIRLLGRAAPLLLIVGVHLFLLGPLASGHRAPGFRDSAYMYYPLFKWMDHQWEQDEIPFWNRYDNFGSPVVEDATTSLFYPGKAVFLIRALPYPSRFGIYLLLHSLLAALGAYWCARVLRANRYGATIAALSYSLSGSVLFQICNVVFLVGAAWLPWSLGCWWLLMKRRDSKFIPWTALTLALMALGGDPQMAFHSALIGMLLAGFTWARSRRPGIKGSLTSLLPFAFKYALTGAMALALAAIQLLPTAAYSKYSERSRQPDHPPRNIYEAFDFYTEPSEEPKSVRSMYEGILAKPTPETHHADVYDFSLPPWALFELIWPNHTGKWMPVFKRWTIPFKSSPRIWTPSIYLGIVPLILGLTAFRFRGSNRVNVWLSWTTILFSLGSLGVYGLFWLVQVIASLFGAELLNSEHAAVGGIYWLMVTFLPKYVLFRYPAKLFVVATLGIGLLAARQLHFRRIDSIRWLSGFAIGILLLTGLAFVYVTVPAFSFHENIGKVGPHETYGPFDSNGCIRDIQTGLLSTAVVITFLLVGRKLVRSNRARPLHFYLGMIAVTSAELLIANSWFVFTVKSETMELPTPQSEVYASIIQSHQSDQNPLVRILRFPRVDYSATSWGAQSSKNRLDEIIWWQRQTLYPKFHLADNISLVGSFSSIETSHQIIEYRSPGPIQYPPWKVGDRETADDYLIGAIVRNMLNVESNDWMEYSDDIPNSSINDAIKIFDRAIVLPGLVRTENAEIKSQIVTFSNNRLEVEFDQVPDSILVSQAWSPGWQAEIFFEDGREPPIAMEVFPYNEASMQLALDPANLNNTNRGKCRLKMTYRPKYFSMGLWISIVAWHVLAALMLAQVLRRIRSRSSR